MARSKHRRKGKTRPRWSLKRHLSTLPPLQPVDNEWEQHKDALLMDQLRKMYGGNNWDDWTEDQIEAAIDEVDRAWRQDPLLAARLREKHGGDWGDWTDGDIDDALRELWRESGEAQPRRQETEPGDG